MNSATQQSDPPPAAQRPPPPADPPAPPRPGAKAAKSSGARPVWNTLAIVAVLLAGLAGGAAILRIKPAAPAAEKGHGEAGEKKGEKGEKGEAGEKKDAHGHGHGGKDEHGASGRVEMNADRVRNAGLKIEEAGSAKVKTTLRLYGKVLPNEETMAYVSPRFAGIIKSVRKRLGDPVAKGEILATVESNDSLRTYDVRSEIAGTVTLRDVTLGESVNDQKTIFGITDTSTVYVDLNVYREDFAQLKVGQQLFVSTNRRGNDAAVGEPPPVVSTLSYLSPFGAENTQSMLARATVANPNGELRPGLFVSARVVIGETEAPIAVRAEAIQILEQKPVVFVQEGDSFEARPVEIGQRDPEWVEIVSGVLPGDRYVSANSFILKAEIGKKGAAHEH